MTMRKKIFLALGAVFGALFLFVGYQLATTKNHSPKATATLKTPAGFGATVVYCQPYKKGRLIFGEAKDGALVPFGQYWRLGANEATEITVPVSTLFAGKPVPAGTYRMYTVPGPSTWRVVLNSELGKWGARDADHGKDVLSVEVPSGHAATALEQFTIRLESGGQPDALQLEFAWDTTLVRVPLAAAK
jgi:hypothetical protein